MQDPTHEPLTRLRQTYQDWQFWAVPKAVGGFTWCARPLSAGDDATQSVNADTPGELEELIRRRT